MPAAKPERGTPHYDELNRLRRIEGQVRGLQRMVEDDRYCIDILTQLASVVGAIKRVESGILERHLKGCVQTSLCKGSREDREKKIEEVIGVFKKFGQ